MKKQLIFIWGCAVMLGTHCLKAHAQTQTQPSAPYEELTVKRNIAPSAWNNQGKLMLQSAWGDTDTRYDNALPPKGVSDKVITLTAWRGERVNAQFVVWAYKDMKNVKFEVSNLKAKKGAMISSVTNIEKGYVRYVMTDELSKDGKTGCGHRPDKTAFDSSLVADVIDRIQVIDFPAHTTRPGWLSIQVPSTVRAGQYKGTVTITADGQKAQKLDIVLNVKNRVLPEPKAWNIHVDWWQNPYAVARVYNVELWSEAHFAAMRPYMEKLASCGQKVITASITYKPWNGQTYDPFDTMVTWLKKADGTWYYDFTVFDKWVEFMMSCGIDQEINCYSMIPWRLSFQYYDQATNSFKMLEAAPGRAEYNAFWGGMLKSFAAHLKEKGWFDKTIIAMDERPMEQMKEVILLVKETVPGMKISLAGNYYAEIEKDVYDYCIAAGQHFPEDVLARRRSEGKKSTYYTCCSEPYPNTFTFSKPAEAEFLGWYALKDDFDGYLRWAFNSWTAEPLKDSRFITWAAGDTYIIYPGVRSSIRLERFIEGVQAYEKFKILESEAKDHRDNNKAKRLEAILKILEWDNIPTNVTDMVRKAKSELNKF